MEDFTGDEALEAADNLLFRLAFGGAAGDVGASGWVVGHAGDGDTPQCIVGVTVSAEVETVSYGRT